MVLGRTPAGAIKIKTDGGLRAVNCACCGPQDFQPCCDCPPVLVGFNFSVIGGPISFTQINNYNLESDCEDGIIRFCDDLFDASGEGTETPSGTPFNFAAAALGREGANLASCGWALFLEAEFELYVTATIQGPDGEIDYIYDNPFRGKTIAPLIFIAGDNPAGTHFVTVDGDSSTQNVPDGWIIIDPPPNQSIYTFTIT